jgi:hypothetical protein
MFFLGFVVLDSGLCALGSKSDNMTVFVNLEGLAVLCSHQAVECASLISVIHVLPSILS